MTIESLNHITLPAALVLCSAIGALSWLGTKNFFVAIALGLVAVMVAFRFAFGH